MGTRAATFSAKIRNLTDFHLRLLHGVVPAPSGLDIATTLKYFSQTLLGVLREIQERPLEMLRLRDQDTTRLALFPNLDYTALHQSLVALVDIMPLIQNNTQEFGQQLLSTLSCLVVFLERRVVDTLPYLVASMMTSIPETLHQHLITTLCYYILPATVGSVGGHMVNEVEGNGDSDGAVLWEEENYAASSVPAVLMMVFQYTDNSAYHCQLLECLMSLKVDIVKDLLCVIAYGTPSARPPAANLLFYYWPGLNPTLFDRRGIHIKFSDISSVLKAMFNKSAQAAKSDSISQTANSDSGESKNPKGWKAMPCQIEECDGEGSNEAAKVCMDHSVCLGATPDNPPPLYLCLECMDDIKCQHSTVEFMDILMPMAQVSATCENKNCRASEKNAMATCFSLECASYNGNRPIRYCSQCNNIRHNRRRGNDHIVHTNMSDPWTMEPQMQNFTIEAIVSLLNEAQPFGDKTKSKDQERLNRAGLLDENDKDESLSPEEARMLSRYGVWLIISLCTPKEDTPIEMLGRILAALCHWFNATQYLPDDQQGAAIERLKNEHIHNWLQEVCKTHFEVFVACLMPHPVEYARVGGHWDTLASRTDHIKEGFNRLFCLVPYEVVTPELWHRVMPHWMEAIHNDIPEAELVDLKITLSKLLDSDMSPLGFDAATMYQFISVRFTNTSASVQEQTLSWLQILSSLNIVIPMNLLLGIFSEGVKSLRCSRPTSRKSSTSSRTHDTPVLEPVVEDDSGNSSGGLSEGESTTPSEGPEDSYSQHQLHLTCFVLMLDVLYKQMEVQSLERNQGLCSGESGPVLAVLGDMLGAPCLSPHTCEGQLECTTCDLTTTFFQLAADINSYICPRLPIQNNRVADILPPEADSSHANRSPEPPPIPQDPPTTTTSSTHSPKPSAPASIQKDMAGGGLISVMANMPQIVTATVETVGELDVAANMPQENVVKAVARAVTLTDEDVAHATASVARASVVGEDDRPIDPTATQEAGLEGAGQEDDFWITSQGKFKFKLQDLPPHLQLVHTLLEMLEVLEDGDVVYHVSECLKYLVLHGEALAMAAADHRGFLIWIQENKSISIMWSLLDAEWSHVGEVCTQLLLHFITLPCGADIFWKLCETHFNHQDWKVRFQAVEKVVVVGRFLGVWSVHQCPGLQAALAHAFCFLLSSLDDLNVAVAQRACLYLITIPNTGLRALCWCLEQQFDSVILDRPMILQALHQLSSRLPDRKILTWDFFYNRFDALYLEAQIALEKYGDVAFPRDLKNSDLTSDLYERKLSRAKDALSLVQSASVRTLSASLGTKWPYKRTMSAPANMVNRSTIEKQQQGDGGMRGGGGYGVDDGSIVHQLQRAMDLEETDKDTIHLLVFLFMQFLSQSQHVGGSEDKGSSAAKTMNLVLRHLSVLMGFSPTERCFIISPTRLRSSPVFNAFLSNLCHVLDHNFNMGTLLLPTCLPVLQFCPAPHRHPDLRHPTFSLWSLQPHPRRYWLRAVLTLLYKYKYNHNPLPNQVVSLVRIVLNTLDAHCHRCRKVDDPTLCGASSAYSREVSQGSLGGNEGDHQAESPPLSPGLYPGSGGSAAAAGGGAGRGGSTASQYFPDHKSAFTPVSQDPRGVSVVQGHHKLGEDGRKQRKNNDANPALDGDDLEPELEAIPESPMSDDSPTCQEFLGDLEPYSAVAIRSKLATMCVESDHGTLSTPCTASQHSTPAIATATTIVVPHTIRAQAVTSVMASQIQAFHESYTVKIHNAELLPVELNVVGGGGSGGERLLTHPHNHHNTPIIVPPLTQYHHYHNTSNTSTTNSDSSASSMVKAIEDRPHHTHLSPKPYQQTLTGEAFRPIDPASVTPPHDLSSSRERLLPVGMGEKCAASEAGCVKGAVAVTDSSRRDNSVADSGRRDKTVAVTVADSGRQDENTVMANIAFQRSPQSPLSMMDLMTLGSPIEVDGGSGGAVDSPPEAPLELPTPERLLPVGGEKSLTRKGDDGSQSSSTILDRVWQAFEGWGGNTNNTNSQAGSDCELVEVVAHTNAVKTLTNKVDSESSRGSGEGGEGGTTTSLDSTTTTTTDTSHSAPTTNNSTTLQGVTEVRCPGKGLGGNGGDRATAATITTTKPRSTDSDDDAGPGGNKDTYRWSEGNDLSSLRSGLTNSNSQAPPPPSSTKQSSLRVGDDCMLYRCMECGEALEQFSNDDLGMCIIILSTFVYRQPSLAAPLLPRMLKTVARVCGHEVFSWQYESGVHLPGSATSIGRQFLRCVLHQLAPNQIFNQIFNTNVEEQQRVQLFRTLAQALTDFNELNPSAPIQLLLENLNSKKVLPTDNLMHLLGNVATYMECVGGEGGFIGGVLSPALIPLFDTFLRKVFLCTGTLDHSALRPIMRVLVAVMRVPGVAGHKNILEPVSKLLSYSIQNSSMEYQHLSDLCHLCNRTFSRERDKLLLPRLVVYELVQALKFKTSIPDTNLVLLVQLVIQDSGGTLGNNTVVPDLPRDIHDIHHLSNTCAAECMRSHLHDALEFIADVHTLTKVKSNCRTSVGLNEDTMGGLVKAGISQYLALEITRGNSRDNRTIAKYLPWLNNPPTTVQQGPREFIDCVAHIRLLSWLLLGALTHSCLAGGASSMVCQPVPPEASCHIADHIQVILAGFAEQSKASVLHMSSLFHAFILCQLWTVYLEQGAGSPGSDTFTSCLAILTDFWAKVTPGILQLVSHSKVLGEMVNLHFMSLMEALHECHSTVLARLLPLWAPVLYTHHTKLPGQLAVRLQACQNAAPPSEPSTTTSTTTTTTTTTITAHSSSLLRWLHRLQFKMGQIELQSSAATQFFSV